MSQQGRCKQSKNRLLYSIQAEMAYSESITEIVNQTDMQPASHSP